MLKLKLQYSGHLMQRVDSLEKTLMLGGIGGRRRRGQQRILTQKHSYFKKKSKQCESCPKATEQGLAARLQKQHLGTRSFWELTELLCNRCQKPP